MGIKSCALSAIILSVTVVAITGCSGGRTSPQENQARTIFFAARGVLLHGIPPRPLSQVRVELVDSIGPMFSPFGPSGPHEFFGSEVITDKSGRFLISIPSSGRLREAERRGSLGLKITSSKGFNIREACDSTGSRRCE